MSAPRTRALADLLRLFVGPVVWFLHLALLYGAEALICTPSVGSGRVMMWLGIAATVTALGILVFLAAVPAPRADGPPSQHRGAIFLHNTTRLLAFLSAIGVIWNALAVALVPVCTLAAS
ncbi:hypothetical protein [Bradyrhizobium paxllaeri]|uniref:hypothetical protein n=1 Tax=Bradyrhizobium paxllaeri TaxID=190148 RepID=UPI0008103D6E|nr:hypothetical protein [Bradyrhizobium paxllaeri]